MLGYFVRRFLQGLLVIFLVTLITFMIPSLFTLNIARAVLGQRATLAAIAHFNHTYGFDHGIIYRYWIYMDQLFHGNLGVSFAGDTKLQPVASTVFPALWETVWLVLFSIVFSVVIAIPLGMTQALRRNTVFDYVSTGFVFLLYSMPAFLLAFLSASYFAIKLKWLPYGVNPGQGTGAFSRLIDIISHPSSYVLPIAVLVCISVGGYSRFMRGSVLDVLVQDYVRTARAKGATSTRVLFKHAMRNAVLPILTILGLTLPALFTGAVITETIFNIGGMGMVIVNATRSFDMSTVMAATLMVAIATVIGNFVADISVSLADPRVRLMGKR